MEDDIQDEPNTKIDIVVTEDKGNSYSIIATYTKDKYLWPCHGKAYVFDGVITRRIITPFLKMFGIDNSLDKQIKDVTCIAIKELKRDFADRESIDKVNTSLTKIALYHKIKCEVGEDGK